MRLRATFLLYATSQFVVLTTAAMFAYAGGTFFDPTTPGYGFTKNFFSDLGTTVAYSGRANWISFGLFFVALVTIGLALVVFAGAWRALAFARGRGGLLGWIGQGCGVLSGLCFVGIACTPWNLLLDVHNTLVLAAFSLLLGYVLSLVGLMVLNGGSRAALAGNVLYLLVLFGYVLLLFFGPNLRTPHGHDVQVLGQKIIVYTSMANLLVQAIAARRAAHAAT